MHGKVAHITMILGGIVTNAKVLAVPGKEIDGTGLFSFNPLQESTRDLLKQLEANKKEMLQGATWKQPQLEEAHQEGVVQGSVGLKIAKVGMEEVETEVTNNTSDQPIVVSQVMGVSAPDVELENKKDDAIKSVKGSTNELVVNGESDDSDSREREEYEKSGGEGEEEGMKELVLGSGVAVPSELAEEVGDTLGGRAEPKGPEEVVIQLAMLTNAHSCDNPRERLNRETRENDSLSPLRKLVDKDEEGFSWEGGLLFRHRLDDLGIPKKQLCLPTEYRNKCLVLAHNHFGHRGKNKVAKDVLKFFYRPTVWRDVGRHCRARDTCQRNTKRNPKQNPMMEREILTVPGEKVCVDVVGPFPKSKRGYTHLLTCIDIASG